MKIRLGVSVAVGFLMAAGPVWAHHSDAVYDLTRLVKIKGTIAEHRLSNPHQIIRIKVKAANGQVTVWELVGASVSRHRDVGWTQNTIQPGEEVTVWGFPFRDGRPNLQWERIEKADGKPLPVPPGAIHDKLARYLSTYGKDQLSAQDFETLKKSVSLDSLQQ
jgi:hypothetical protein